VDPAALNLTTKVIGYGRLLFLHLDAPTGGAIAADIETLSASLDNAHAVDGAPTPEASRKGRYQYLRAEPSRGRELDLADTGICGASALVRLEGSALEPLLDYEKSLRALVEARGGAMHTRAGIQKELSYTSHAMAEFAYAHAFGPKSGRACPFGVVTPQDKTAEWWAMDWMRRESFFLPRYDENGRMLTKGHALASAGGIPCITRRLLHNADGYGQPGGYDFIGYFEFAERDAGTFRDVMAGLRDRAENPEWVYVREGPEWWGWRVERAAQMWTPATTASSPPRPALGGAAGALHTGGAR
jgi:hypothetical protein